MNGSRKSESDLVVAALRVNLKLISYDLEDSKATEVTWRRARGDREGRMTTSTKVFLTSIYRKLYMLLSYSIQT